jgi:exonuclease SbcC
VIVDSLVMKNFKRFRHQEIRFSDGITGILGNNGTGKSSIVEAIFFALFGVQATGILSDYIVSSFAGPRDRCEVRLDFRVGGDDFTVLRTFRRGKTIQHEATFYRGQKLRATGVSQVEAEVKRTLGMGPVDFRNTVYAAQKDLLTLLEHTPGKRREWFLRALGIDYLKNESDRLLKERIDAKEREFQLAEGELRGLLGRYDPEERNALESSLAEGMDTLESLAQQAEAHAARRAQVLQDLQDFLNNKTEHTRLLERFAALSRETEGLAKQREQISAQIAALAGQEEEFGRLERDLAGYDAKRQQLADLQRQKSEFDRLSAEQRFAGQACGTLKERIAREQSKKQSLDRDAVRLASLRQDIRGLLGIGLDIPDTALEQAVASREAEILHANGTISARLALLVDERKKLVSDWTTIESAGADGVCPLCRQTLGSHYGQIKDEFSSRLEWIEQEALRVCSEQDRVAAEKDLISRQKPAITEIRGILERLKTRDIIDADLRDLTAQLQAKTAGQIALETRIRELGFDEAVYAGTEKEIAELERIRARFIELGKIISHGSAVKTQLADLDRSIAEKKGDLTKLKSLIDQSAFEPGIGPLLEQSLAGIDSALRAVEAERAGTTERLRHIGDQIERCRRDEAALAGLQGKTASLQDEINLLRLTRSLIGEYVLYLMQVVRSRIEGEVSRILSEITGGRYDQVLLDEDFNLLVRDLDNDYPIERFSGGEQDDIAVALRIALSRYLAELYQVHESTLLIFDEIFGSQDEERRTNLLSALRTQESRFPQIIIISHIPDIQGEFTTTLMVEMGTDLSSRVREAT